MVEVTLVSLADCPNCVDTKKQLNDLQGTYPGIVIKSVDAYSSEGEALIMQHGIMASPGILINGNFFSAGMVSEQKLTEAIKSVAEAA